MASASGVDLEGQPSLKRSRPNETRDKDLYFEDGSVVLSADDADGGLVFFRVHKFILAKHSSVFKDMFAIPSPPDIDVYDGIPLAHIPDNFKELKDFLQAMYDPSFLPFRRFDPKTPRLVAGVLKLSTKYNAEALRNRIISHLEMDWPTSLYEWDQVMYTLLEPDPDTSLSSDETHSGPLSGSGTKSADVFALDPVPYISFVRESGMHKMFAIILYSLCRESSTRLERISRMTHEDLKILMLGKERMMSFICGPAVDELGIHEWTNEDYSQDYGYSVFCFKDQCYIPVYRAWLDILQEVSRSGDPLAVFGKEAQIMLKYADDYKDDDGEQEYQNSYNSSYYIRDDMCPICQERMAERLEALRQTIFNKLPSFFTLGNNFSDHPHDWT